MAIAATILRSSRTSGPTMTCAPRAAPPRTRRARRPRRARTRAGASPAALGRREEAAAHRLRRARVGRASSGRMSAMSHRLRYRVRWNRAGRNGIACRWRLYRGRWLARVATVSGGIGAGCVGAADGARAAIGACAADMRAPQVSSQRTMRRPTPTRWRRRQARAGQGALRRGNGHRRESDGGEANGTDPTKGRERRDAISREAGHYMWWQHRWVTCAT